MSMDSVDLWELISIKLAKSVIYRSKIDKTAKKLQFAQNQLFVLCTFQFLSEKQKSVN